jgi:hypothetical protein
MAANNFYGLNVRWSTNGIACTSFGASLFQGTDVERSKTVSTYHNQLGNTAIVCMSDPTKDGTLTLIPANSSTADGNLVTSALEPDAGTAIVLTDSLDGSAWIVGNNWKIISFGVRRTVNGIEEVSYKVKAWDGVP